MISKPWKSQEKVSQVSSSPRSWAEQTNHTQATPHLLIIVGWMLHAAPARPERHERVENNTCLRHPGGTDWSWARMRWYRYTSHQTQCGPCTAVAYDAGVSIIGRGRGVITTEDTWWDNLRSERAFEMNPRLAWATEGQLWWVNTKWHCVQAPAAVAHFMTHFITLLSNNCKQTLRV